VIAALALFEKLKAIAYEHGHKHQIRAIELMLAYDLGRPVQTQNVRMTAASPISPMRNSRLLLARERQMPQESGIERPLRNERSTHEVSRLGWDRNQAHPAGQGRRR
jgi:hypothetical protein